jgi:WhiB family transcriptional regulator, redox-sensing transcriptional regulator
MNTPRTREQQRLTLEAQFREWSETAPCKDAEGVDFFSFERNEINKAIAVCTTCPYREKCLEYADFNKIEHGVWGGVNMTRYSRRSQARRVGGSALRNTSSN